MMDKHFFCCLCETIKKKASCFCSHSWFFCHLFYVCTGVVALLVGAVALHDRWRQFAFWYVCKAYSSHWVVWFSIKFLAPNVVPLFKVAVSIAIITCWLDVLQNWTVLLNWKVWQLYTQLQSSLDVWVTRRSLNVHKQINWSKCC